MSTAVAVGRKLVFTGGSQRESTGLVQILDVDTGVVKASRLPSRRSGMSAVSIGSKVYFVGGGDYDQSSFANLFVYDLNTDQWAIEPLALRRHLTGAAVSGTKLIIGGGNDYDTVYKKVEIIDTSTGLHTEMDLSTERTNHTVHAIGNKVYFIGGNRCIYYYVNPLCAALDTIEVLDLSTGVSSLVTMPTSRSAHQSVVVGSKIIIAGTGPASLGSCDKMDVYDTANGQWKTYSIPPINRLHFGISVGQYAVFAGGLHEQNKITIFKSSDETFNFSTELQIPRYNLTGASIDGVAYLGGGQAPSLEESRHVEILDPVRGKISFLK